MAGGVMYQPEILSDETFTLAECPNWDAANNRLYWTDILNCKLHALDVATGLRKTWTFDSELGCFGLTDQGRIIVALRKDILFLDPKTDARAPLCRIEDGINSRTNDGKIGPDGALGFTGDSDALIVRGLIALLHTLLADRPAEEILATDAQAQFARLGLDQALSSQRSNGLRAMIARLKDLASAQAAQSAGAWNSRWQYSVRMICSRSPRLSR